MNEDEQLANDMKRVAAVQRALDGNADVKIVDQLAVRMTNGQVNDAIAQSAFKRLRTHAKGCAWAWTTKNSDGSAVVKMLLFDREIDSKEAQAIFEGQQW